MKPEESVKKSVDYYMSLHYTVKLRPSGEGYEASIEELPGCRATASASDSVEKLWQLLEKNQRKWIEQELKMGREVPEPPGATRDPFWDDFEEAVPGYDGEDVVSMLYRHGVTSFPLRILQELWLEELQDVRLSEVGASGVPPKAETDHYDQRSPWLKGDVRPVRLGKSLKKAWIGLDGARTKYGYKNIEILDKSLRTEAAMVAALTVLETEIIKDSDFEKLRKALLRYVSTNPGLRGKNLQEVLDRLPVYWFRDRKDELVEKRLEELHEGLRKLSPKEQDKERRNRLKEVQRWERFYPLWERSIRYIVALLHYRRPDFNTYALEQQLDLVNKHRKSINEFLEKQREHMAVLEYGNPGKTPPPVRRARDQVRAAVLQDVEGLAPPEIANRLGIVVDKDKYETDNKISEVTRLIEKGRLLLGRALTGEGGWQKRAEEMKDEAKRYNALSEAEKLIEREAEITGRTVEQVRSYYQRIGGGPSRFMATDFFDHRPQP